MPVPVAPPIPVIAAPARASPCGKQISLRFSPSDATSEQPRRNDRVLLLHNVGPSACEIQGFPDIVFRDDAGKALPIERANPFSHRHGGAIMGHGPAMPFVAVPAGRTASISISWSDVGRVCFDTSALTVEDGFPHPVDVYDRHGLSIKARVCGDTTDDVEFRQAILAVDP